MTRVSGDDWRVCIVAAGPGTGKTTFAAQWLAGTDGAWLSLDDAADHPETFWLSVATALQHARPGAFDATEQLATRSRTDSALFVMQFLDDAAALERSLEFVLEDFHVLRNPAIIASFASVIENLPAQLRFVITSRSDPALPTARWRARSWVADIRQRDLAFDEDETRSLLAALGAPVFAPGEIVELQTRTEGWVAALILMAGARRDADEAGVARRLTGSNRMIADLLAEEVIERQPDDVRDLMLCSSIVDDFDPDLCDILAGRRDSRACLESLERETHFLVTVEPRGAYRYHPLLKDLLRAELDRLYPGRAADLHLSAARAFIARGDFSSAVAHYVAHGDRDRAFQLVLDPRFEWREHDDVARTAAWLDAFPAEFLAESVERMLNFAFALMLCWRWNEAHAWLNRAEHALAAEPCSRVEDVVLLDILRLYEFISDAADATGIECGHRALGHIDRGVELGIAGERVRPGLARAHLLVDDPEGAEDALRGPIHGGEISATVVPLGVRARIALRQGHLRAAAEHSEKALAAASAFEMPKHFVTLDAHIALLGVLTDRDDLAAARRVVEQIESVTAGHPAFAYRIIGRLDEVRLAAARGLEDAFAVVDDLRILLHERDRPTLRSFVDAIEARLHLDAGETSKAEALADRLHPGTPARHLLVARLHLARGSTTHARERLDRATLTSVRDRLTAELLSVRACVMSGEDPERHLSRVVELAAPEHLVRVVLEEGDVVARLVRSAAERVGVIEAEQFATALGSPPRLRHSADAFVTLTEREQAVLRFLPSRLTNQEIGGECFMSVNTVKAHLKAIYNKLGVSSRSDAVERARMLGAL